MRTHRLRCAISMLALFFGAAHLSAGEPQTVYEWLATAPVVLAAEHVDTPGKFAQFRVETVLRGEVPAEGVIRVALRRANRDRNRQVVKEALKFEKGMSYLLLLTPASKSKPDAPPTFDLIRGARGAREIPAEGRRRFLEAMERFVRIQTRNDDLFTWRELRVMLEETDPLLIETALDQFLKFGRGDARLLGTLRPLLDHPAQEMRERTARLIGQILRRGGTDAVPELAPLQAELASKARRDDSVPVRVAATEALNEIDGATVEEILAEIAREDPDQSVRYTAERLIYDRKQRKPGTRSGKNEGRPPDVATGGRSD